LLKERAPTPVSRKKLAEREKLLKPRGASKEHVLSRTGRTEKDRTENWKSVGRAIEAVRRAHEASKRIEIDGVHPRPLPVARER
jgi:hypothetical protein